MAAVEGDGRSEYFSLSGIRQLTLTGRVFIPGEDDPAAPAEQARPLKPFTARIRMNGVPQDSSWGGYRLRAAAEEVYEVDFFMIPARSSHNYSRRSGVPSCPPQMAEGQAPQHL
ncbi:hypothetical protein ACFTAO_18580 [Paenibacillus rhizoplanae]